MRQVLAVLILVLMFGAVGAGPALAGNGADEAEEAAAVAGIPAAVLGAGDEDVAAVSETIAGADDAAAVDETEDPAEIVRRSFAARWERPVRFREVRTMMRGDRSETMVRRVWWRPWTGLRVEEDYEQGRRMMWWNEDGQWLYDTRFPFALHIEARGLDRLRVRGDAAAPEGEGAAAGDGPHPGRGPHGIGLRVEPGPYGAGAPELEPHGRGFMPPVRTPRFVTPDQWECRLEIGPGGRPVFVVERRGPGGVSRWWIDREHHFPWKEEHFGPDDELSAVIIRSDLELDADIEDEVFEFEAPEGVDVLRDPRDWRRRVVLHTVRERLPFRAALPRVVPEGFELIDGSVAWLQGQPALHWRFYDGQRLLSVFQLRLEVPEGRFRGRQAPAPTVTQMEAGRVVGVVRDGFLFFVVGDVTTEEALEILESLEEVAD